jgi:2-dehydro-3-deoxyphosphogluconate aldolase/(4S)-4-hydroxy-2-oxoglutarate aldolase
MDIFEKLSLFGLIPVIKIEDAQSAVPLCAALMAGGLPVAEITFRTSAAEEAIRRVRADLPDVLLGAGTVLSVEQVQRAVSAGATYIVSPGFNPDVVAYCVQNGIPILPGCSSPSDLERALAFGLRIVKFFPAEALGGLALIKAMSAPYGSISFVPTGGIDEKNLVAYLSSPKVIAVGGSFMVPERAIAQGDFQTIQRLTREAVNLSLGFEIRHIGINSGSKERAQKDAEALSKLLGWPIRDGETAAFVGDGVEVMKRPFRGTHGHIAVATNDVARARFQLEKKGFVFDETSERITNGKPTLIYLADEIAGFAVHLLAK